MARRAFFFPHPVEPNLGPKGLPGRVPFDVVGDLVDTVDGTTSRGSVRVCADGYQPNIVGPNQDPCVFDGPFHAFCRIDSTRGDNCVKGTRRPLSLIVKEGDVVIYGKFEPKGQGPTTLVWVDTVLVVDSCKPWPTSTRTPGTSCRSSACRDKPLLFTSPARMASALTGAPNGVRTPAYRFTLYDAESNGMHCCRGRGEHRIILGRRLPSTDAVRSLQTSFVTMTDDFNGAPFPAFVGSSELGPEWPRLQAFIDTVVRRTGAGPRGGWIAEFPDFELAQALCAAIIATSGRSQGRPGTVAIPPLEPAAPVWRWSPVTRSVSGTPV